jgi:hypothetical protein
MDPFNGLPCNTLFNRNADFRAFCMRVNSVVVGRFVDTRLLVVVETAADDDNGLMDESSDDDNTAVSFDRSGVSVTDETAFNTTIRA